MMKKQVMQISLEQAKRLVLTQQQLLYPASAKGKKAVIATIDQLGYLQIDTLHVIVRAHHHTLWSRLPDYKESFLNELLEKDKKIFEYWSHAASYLPMADFRFSLPRKKLYADGKSHWFAQDKKINKYVLDRIKAEGPLQSKDFAHKKDETGNWYNWKPAKQALEQLFMEGKLMVAKRHNFQKVYDLTERIIPSTIDTSMPGKNEYANYLIKRAIKANGIANELEIAYLRTGQKEIIAQEVRSMLKRGELIKVEIETLKGTYLMLQEQLDLLIKHISSTKEGPQIHLLSPFDNLIIQRKRLSNLFEFDYAIECYLPESKRKFGYWSLPVLYKNEFVARFDTKADRVTGTYYIKSIFFEKKFFPTKEFNYLFEQKLRAFATFNGCSKITLQKADNPLWKREMSLILK